AGAHAQIEPVFEGTRPTGQVLSLVLTGMPPLNMDTANEHLPIVEVFLRDRANLLQLTTFQRYDTAGIASISHGRRVLLIASDPTFAPILRANSQLLSVGALGGGVRPITHFATGVMSVDHCSNGAAAGCAFADIFEDPRTHEFVFSSSCDPFHTRKY